MDNITMTIDAPHMARVRSACPETASVLLASTAGWIRDTRVPTSVVIADTQALQYAGDVFLADVKGVKDFEYRPFGEPPV